MAGKITLTRNGATGSVVNDGNLQAALGGYIALLAPEVRNGGVIIARLGTVAMASGESVTLNLDGNHLAGITVQTLADRCTGREQGRRARARRLDHSFGEGGRQPARRRGE